MSKNRFQLSSLFGNLFDSKPTAREVTQRVSRAAESILENEGLTGELDDAAAEELLDWGISWAKMIARDTAELNDDQAEEAMSPRLRATRRLMRAVNRWIAKQQEMDAEGSAAALTRIIDQAAIVYGEDFTPPDSDQLATFSSQQAQFLSSPQQMIANLRQLLEDNHPSIKEQNNGQEN